jgi:hypothetical protein
MNNQVIKGKELIVYSESLPVQDDSSKIKRILTKLEDYYNKLINSNSFQKTQELAKRYGNLAIALLCLLIAIGLFFFPHRMIFLTSLLSKLSTVFLSFI